MSETLPGGWVRTDDHTSLEQRWERHEDGHDISYVYAPLEQAIRASEREHSAPAIDALQATMRALQEQVEAFRRAAIGHMDGTYGKLSETAYVFECAQADHSSHNCPLIAAYELTDPLRGVGGK